jgi:hypothetical protein
MHTVRCTAVAWRPARRAACLCNLALEGAGPVVFALIKPGQELRVSQEFLHPGFDMGVEVLVFPVAPEGVLFHGVAFPARPARLWGLVLGVKKEKTPS